MSGAEVLIRKTPEMVNCVYRWSWGVRYRSAREAGVPYGAYRVP